MSEQPSANPAGKTDSGESSTSPPPSTPSSSASSYELDAPSRAVRSAGDTQAGDSADGQREQTDRADQSPRPGLFKRALNALEKLQLTFASDTIPVMAAALAYRTIFSLVPLLAIGLVILRLVNNDDAKVRALLNKLLDQAGLSAIVSSPPPGSAASDGAGAAPIQQWLDTIVSKFSSISFAGIGLVSAALLIYAAIGLLVELEKAFNTVFAVQRGRSWPERITRYWLTVSIGPLIVYGSFTVSEQAAAIAAEIAKDAVGSNFSAHAVQALGFLLSVVLSAFLLCVLYLTVTNTKVRVRSAILGSLVAAFALEGAKYGFRLYVAGGGVQSLYGALALVPLFMLWLYTTWFIVLLGLRISFISQHYSTDFLLLTHRPASRSPGAQGVCVDPLAAVAVLSLLARRFESAKPPADAEIVASTLSLDPVFTRRLLERAATLGLVLRAEGGGYALARSPGSVTIAQVLSLGYELSSTGGGSSEQAVTLRLRAQMLKALGSRTLADELNPPSANGKGPATPSGSSSSANADANAPLASVPKRA
ncbi:MAG: YihY family inner membrane protein [Phycisphaerales bacterium]|nr:YihY family inner membrane protein [Phycisphaerales bacterium]